MKYFKDYRIHKGKIYDDSTFANMYRNIETLLKDPDSYIGDTATVRHDPVRALKNLNIDR